MTLRIGTSINQSAAEGADPVADARHAESLGFDLVTVTDHLSGTRPTYETWTLLTAIAAATERVLVAPNVLGLHYRHPAVTAKMAESLHRLSGGRFILGFGGGASNEEAHVFGLPVRKPKEKIDALEEALGIIVGLWTEDGFTYEGRHYSVHEATIEPKPEEKIPIWLGVYGRRALGLAGRLADGWIPSYPFAPPERRKEMQERVRLAATQADRDPDDIAYAYNVGVRVDEAAEARPKMIAGSPDEVTERLIELVEDGVTVLNIWPAGPGEEQRERLAAEVVPHLRAAAS